MRPTTRAVLTPLALGMLLAACTSRGGLVDRGMILPPGAELIALEEHQMFLMAIPVESPDPQFPDVDLRPGEAVVICARFVVTEHGRVTNVETFDDMAGCEPGASARGAPFSESVRLALQQWTFFGAATCRFLVSEKECRAGEAEVVAVPIRLAYRFEFSVGTGRRGSVSVRDLGGG